MTECKKDTVVVMIIKRNTIPLSKNRQLAQKQIKIQAANQKKGVAEAA